MIDSMRSRFPHLPVSEIFQTCRHSRSQLYQWRRRVNERKARQRKALGEDVVENAAITIAAFPHFGGKKGQAFMLYHRLGFIGRKAYDIIKRQVRRIFRQEVSGRKDIPAGGGEYEHIRPERIGQIWAEDFTEIVLDGISLKYALLIDVFSQYILGWALAPRATESLVAIPVCQALAANDGKGPELFLLQDNGKQYVSDDHSRLLLSHEIVGRHIPGYTPQYNGSVECGGKEFKNVFYNVWERRERNGMDKEKTLLERAQLSAAESVHHLNKEIPRPALGGVTPADVQHGRKASLMEAIKRHRLEEIEKGEPPPLSRPYWEVLKDGVRADIMSTKELLIKLAFFGMRPLRRVAQLNREVWGN